ARVRHTRDGEAGPGPELVRRGGGERGDPAPAARGRNDALVRNTGGGRGVRNDRDQQSGLLILVVLKRVPTRVRAGRKDEDLLPQGACHELPDQPCGRSDRHAERIAETAGEDGVGVATGSVEEGVVAGDASVAIDA